MEGLLFPLFCVGIVVVVLAINYIAVTRQEQREGTSPYYMPGQIDWDAIADEQLQDALRQGKKIEAIKRYRELTGAGLKEAKDAVEYAEKHPDESGDISLSTSEPGHLDADAAEDWQIRADIGRGNKIEAIKRYRELTGAGLKEAKDAVEYIARNPDMWAEKKKAPRLELDAPGIRDLLEEGREDEAVEVYQKFAGVDEYSARDAVERIKREMGNEG